MSSMFNLIATAAAVALLPLAQPAVAASAPDGADQLRAKVLKRGDQTYYCFKQEITGSRMQRRVCLTEQELSNAGARIEGAGEEIQVVSGPAAKVASQN